MKIKYFFPLVCLYLLMAAVNAGAASFTVSSQSPVSGAVNVAVASPVSVTFSQNVNCGTVTATTFELKQGATIVTCNPVTPSCAGKTATCTPASHLSPLTVYSVVLATGATGILDTGGDKLTGAGVTWSFTTVAVPPTVTAVTPTNGSTGQLYSVTPTATFNQAMDPSTITTSTFTLKTTSSGSAVAGTVTYNSSTNTATFTPSANLAVLTQYTATITTGVKSSPQETAMASNYTWSFTTKDVPPTVAAYTPTPSGLTGQAVNVAPSATFSEQMTISTLTGLTFYLTNNTTGISVPATITTATSTSPPCTAAIPCTIATLTPSVSLAYMTTYTVTVTTGVSNTYAQNLASNFSWTFSTVPVPMINYCVDPPFVSAAVQPNVLIILDNSQNFDEDFEGNAVGSTAPNSKSVVGRQTLINIINTYGNDMRIGIMTYAQNAVGSWYVHNSPYFASYDPRTYCPNPPSACVSYCKKGSTSETLPDGTITNTHDYCNSQCQMQNPAFDATFAFNDDPILSHYPINNALRNNYCTLIYPKTQEMANPSDPSTYIYYKEASPFYDSSDDGTAYCYSSNYNPGEYPVVINNYYCFSAKNGVNETSDAVCNTNTCAANGYGGSLVLQGGLEPTDSDIANGYNNFGQRLEWTYENRCWFNNTSPGGGYLNLACNTNNSTTHQVTTLLDLLGDNANNAYDYLSTPDYMSCTTPGTPNKCKTSTGGYPYIVNAGLTPTGGALESALDYFTGVHDYNSGVSYTSPIQYRCQKNYVIYVTAGIASVNETGTPETTATLLPDILNWLTSLQNISYTLSGTSYPFDVETFIVGLGLNNADVPTLNSMAVAGGTAVNGQAYFANDADQLSDALGNIFQNILTRVSSGTAASVLASGEGSGANIIEAIFYPLRTFIGGTQVSWVGSLQNLWYYLDPTSQNSTIRSNNATDGSGNPELDLTSDYIVNFYFDSTSNATMVNLYQDPLGNNVPAANPTSTVPVEELSFIWEAGTVLWQMPATSRTLYTSTFPVTGSTTLIPFTAANTATLYPYMQTVSLDETEAMIDYITGTDAPITVTDGTTYPLGYVAPPNNTGDPNYRSRTTPDDVNNNGVLDLPQEGPKVWKLGDIIDSTPRIVSWIPLNQYDTVYGDTTYSSFYGQTTYKNRGMVFTGGNDGMLHAFKLGTLNLINNGTAVKATLLNPDSSTPLGTEMWAYIPFNSLPYLRYLSDPGYCHIYYVDGTPYIFDASINVDTSIAQPSNCDTTDGSADLTHGYFNCNKNPNTGANWRTILIGSMRTGGGCKIAASNYEVQVPLQLSSGQGVGYSSYFALDVTDPTSPTLLWEFSNPNLGYSTSGPAIVKINAQKVVNGNGVPDTTRNGKWFVIFASGPTGPINPSAYQFDGYSDQDLQLFVLDLTTGNLLRTIDTGIADAFGGTLTNGQNDYDHSYQDDVVYEGYTNAETSTLSSAQWIQGGVIRLLTKTLLTGNSSSGYSVNNTALNPANWEWSYLAKNIGAVTAAVAHIAHYPTGSTYPDTGYAFYGTGRYFFKTTAIDAANVQNSIFGVIDPCLPKMTITAGSSGPVNPPAMSLTTRVCNDTTQTNTACSLGASANDIVDIGGETCLQNATSNSITIAPNTFGWYINLANPTSGNLVAERVITDPLAATSGAVFFTTFQPSTDVCDYGGQTNLWGVAYNTAGSVNGMLQGQALIQVSTGVINQVQLNSVFTNNAAGGVAGQGRSTSANLMGGVPAPGAPSFIVPPKPVNQIMSIIKRIN
jgi:hypothetical protein